jgi:two-component system, OmpR family, response regulator
VPMQRRRLPARLTSQRPPYSQPSSPHTAASIRGAASARVADSARARAISCTMVTTALHYPRSITMATPSPAARRVLVVDDDRTLRFAVAGLLQDAGFLAGQAADGPDALQHLQADGADLVLLDIGLPGMSGLDVLSRIMSLPAPPQVVMLTADDTPEALLQAVRGQAHRYIRKPIAPGRIVDVVREVLAAPPATTVPIEVVSARREWVELVAPCSLGAANRIHEFVMQLDADLPQDIRESVGQAFRELLMNAVEWGGKLDPNRTVRISCLRGKRLLLYRIADPGEGFDIEGLSHAAICNPVDDPLSHARVREERGIRPGGLGLVLSQALGDEVIYNEKRNEVVLLKYLE